MWTNDKRDVEVLLVGMGGMCLVFFTVIPQEGPGPACPVQHLAVCQIFNKFLEYFLSFACSNIRLNTGLQLHIHRSV